MTRTTLALILLSSALAGLPARALMIYQAEDALDTTYQLPFPAGSATETGFLGALPGPPLVDSLDGAPAGWHLKLPLFAGRAFMDQSAGGGMVVDADSECFGKSRCLVGYLGADGVVINFAQPVSAFAFWANDLNTVDDAVTVRVNGFPAPFGAIAGQGFVSFFGVIAETTAEMITSIGLNSSNPDGLLVFDRFITSLTPPKVAVPGPAPLLGAVAVWGWGRRLRARLRP